MKRQLQGVRKVWRKATDGWIFAGCALAVAVTAGCATKGTELAAGSPPEVKAAAVKERANARWAALIKGDKDAAYAYLSPGGRQMISAEQFNARVKADGFRAAQVDRVDCEAESCKVMLRVTYDFVPPKGGTAVKAITTAVQETWVVENGQVWLVWRP